MEEKMKKALSSVVVVLLLTGFVCAQKVHMRSAFEVSKCVTLKNGTTQCDVDMILPQEIEIELASKDSDSPDYRMWEGAWTKVISTTDGTTFIGNIGVTRYVFSDGRENFSVAGYIYDNISSTPQNTMVSVWVTSMDKLNDVILPGDPRTYEEGDTLVQLWPVLIMGASLQDRPFAPVSIKPILERK